MHPNHRIKTGKDCIMILPLHFNPSYQTSTSCPINMIVWVQTDVSKGFCYIYNTRMLK